MPAIEFGQFYEIGAVICVTIECFMERLLWRTFRITKNLSVECSDMLLCDCRSCVPIFASEMLRRMQQAPICRPLIAVPGRDLSFFQTKLLTGLDINLPMRCSPLAPQAVESCAGWNLSSAPAKFKRSPHPQELRILASSRPTPHCSRHKLLLCVRKPPKSHAMCFIASSSLFKWFISKPTEAPRNTKVKMWNLVKLQRFFL